MFRCNVLSHGSVHIAVDAAQPHPAGEEFDAFLEKFGIQWQNDQLNPIPLPQSRILAPESVFFYVVFVVLRAYSPFEGSHFRLSNRERMSHRLGALVELINCFIYGCRRAILMSRNTASN